MKAETKLFTMRPYSALPCALEVFRVKGIKAYESDFGEGRDVKGPSDDWEYACGDMRFFPYRTPKAGVLAKYGITLAEYREICKELKKVLFVGECGWCV